MAGTKRGLDAVDDRGDDGGFLGPAPKKNQGGGAPAKRSRTDAGQGKGKGKGKFKGTRGKGANRLAGPGKGGDKPVAYTRQERKELKKERQMKRPFAHEMSQAKKAWEQLRQKTVEAKKKHEIIDTVLQVLEGKIYDTVTKHSASRIVQCMVKYGTAKQREVITKALKGKMVELSRTPYAHFLVMKLLKYGEKGTRASILKEMYSHVRSMIRHKQASVVIEYAFAEIATGQQQSNLIQEFYGPEFAYFKIGQAKSIKDLIKEDASRRKSILAFMKEVLGNLIEKRFVGLTIVHRVILEYMTYADTAESADLVPGLLENAVDLMHTREGVQVFVHALATSGAKERKQVIKALKGLISKICSNEYGALALVALMSMVDDTVLVKKSIISELNSDIFTIITDKSSQRVVLYPFSWDSNVIFGPSVRSAVTPREGLNKFSKKDPDVRRRELAASLMAPFLKACNTHAGELLVSPHGSIALMEALTRPMGDKGEDAQAEARASVLDAVASDPALVRDHVAVRALKNLIEPKKQRDDLIHDETFASKLLDILEPRLTELALEGNFVVVRLLDCKSVKAKVVKALKGVKKQLGQGECKERKGCQLIAEAL